MYKLKCKLKVYTHARQIINLLLPDNFYPVMSRRRVQKESDELLYTVFGHSLWSASQLPTQEVNCPSVDPKTLVPMNYYFSLLFDQIEARLGLT